MPRAKRCLLRNHIWLVTHRCYEKAFLLKFARERELYLRYLFEAKKSFGLCVLNYMVTSNHVHLLVRDTREGVIASSVQLAAGGVAQDYNRRKARNGAFWEDRYHATAIETGQHLRRCLVYIDLNMVRASVVRHPGEWGQSGYQEIQAPPERYAIIDQAALAEACGMGSMEDLRETHRRWIHDALIADKSARDDRWSKAVAVGSAAYVEKVKRELRRRPKERTITETPDGVALHEARKSYRSDFGGKKDALKEENALYWNEPSCGRRGLTRSDPGRL